MNNHETKKLHSEYIDRSLPESDQHRVEAHAAECDACRSDLDSLTQTVDRLADIPKVVAPVNFTGQVMARVREAPQRKVPIRFRRRRLVIAIAQGLAALLVIGFAFRLVVQTRQESTPDQMAKVASPKAESAGRFAQSGPEPLVSDENEENGRQASLLTFTDLSRRFDDYDYVTISPGDRRTNFETTTLRRRTEEVIGEQGEPGGEGEAELAGLTASVEVYDEGNRLLKRLPNVVPIDELVEGSFNRLEKSTASLNVGARRYRPEPKGQRAHQLASATESLGNKSRGYSETNRSTAFAQMRSIRVTLAATDSEEVDRLVAANASQVAALEVQRAMQNDEGEKWAFRSWESEKHNKAMKKPNFDLKYKEAYLPVQVQLECYQRMELLPRQSEKKDGKYKRKGFDQELVKRSGSATQALRSLLFRKDQSVTFAIDAEGKPILVAQVTELEYRELNRRLDTLEPVYATLAGQVRARFREIDGLSKLEKPGTKNHVDNEPATSVSSQLSPSGKSRDGVEDRITVVIAIRPDLAALLSEPERLDDQLRSLGYITEEPEP